MRKRFSLFSTYIILHVKLAPKRIDIGLMMWYDIGVGGNANRPILKTKKPAHIVRCGDEGSDTGISEASERPVQ